MQEIFPYITIVSWLVDRAEVMMFIHPLVVVLEMIDGKALPSSTFFTTIGSCGAQHLPFLMLVHVWKQQYFPLSVLMWKQYSFFFTIGSCVIAARLLVNRVCFLFFSWVYLE